MIRARPSQAVLRIVRTAWLSQAAVRQATERKPCQVGKCRFYNGL